MARFSEDQIESLKRDVSLERLIESQGHVLKAKGRDRVLACPFHEGKAASRLD